MLKPFYYDEYKIVIVILIINCFIFWKNLRSSSTMQYKIHVEVELRSPSDPKDNGIIEMIVVQHLKDTGYVIPGQLQVMKIPLSDEYLGIRTCEIDEFFLDNEMSANDSKYQNGDCIPYSEVELIVHMYRLVEFTQPASFGGDGEDTASRHILLPAAEFAHMWESLIYDEPIKEKLLKYALASVHLSKNGVDPNIVGWNRVILLYGPPGTGKTSLCKALAQKLSIRFTKLYKQVEFIEINSHSLFSKYYSESGKLVLKIFAKINEHLAYGKTFVCVLIDEIESLTRARNACMTDVEPSDSIRVVNALLTQLDAIKKHSNVLILTTSNLKSAIDMAFVDRTDLQIYIDVPTAIAIQKIFESAVHEFLRRGVLTLSEGREQTPTSETNDSPQRTRRCDTNSQPDNYENDTEMLSPEDGSDIYELQEEENEDMGFDWRDDLVVASKMAVGLSGRALRRIPFLAYVRISNREEKTTDQFVVHMKEVIRDCRKEHALGVANSGMERTSGITTAKIVPE